MKRKLLGKKISTYAVDYPASWNFPKSTSLGAQDANRHVQQVAGLCPETKIVLGGMTAGFGGDRSDHHRQPPNLVLHTRTAARRDGESYLWNGMVNEAATYVARKVLNTAA